MNRRDALKALTALPGVASIAVADVKPNDVIVVECDECLSRDAMERIRATVKEIWSNRKVIVLDKGMRLKIAREPAIPDPPPDIGGLISQGL